MDTDGRRILGEFKNSRNIYLSLEDFVSDKLHSMIKEKNLFVMEISHRTKTPDSLGKKLSKKNGKYKNIREVTDLCGMRIICYFSDTVDLVAECLKEKFIIDEVNSVDKRRNLNATEFGYLSLHYICALNENDCIEHPEFEGIYFEIQIRSTLQHAWAEIEHDLGYKSEFGVPKKVRREFSRVAGLLEIADSQFIALRHSVHEYENMVRTKIGNDDADDIPLDMVSLSEYVRINKAFKSFLEDICSQCNAEYEIISPENYLKQLAYLKIETIGDLGRLLEDNKDSAKAMMVKRLKSFELDIFSTNMALRYLCRAKLLTDGYSKNQVEEFVRLAIDDEERIQMYVNKIIDAQKVPSN